MRQQGEVIDAPTGPQKAVEDVGGRRDQVLFKPAMAAVVDKDDAALIGGMEKGLNRGGGRQEIAGIAGIAPRTYEEGNALTLGQARVPGSVEGRAIVPIEVVVPNHETGGIGLEVVDKPVGNVEKFCAAIFVPGGLVEIEIAESVLRDGDGIGLEADRSVVVEQRNAVGVEGSGVIRFRTEGHVVEPEFSRGEAGDLRVLMPESELTHLGCEISAGNAAVVTESAQQDWLLVGSHFGARCSGHQ